MDEPGRSIEGEGGAAVNAPGCHVPVVLTAPVPGDVPGRDGEEVLPLYVTVRPRMGRAGEEFSPVAPEGL